MRVRRQPKPITRRPGRGAHPLPRVTAPNAAPPSATDRPDERRARESGGPIDNALYSCSCGMVFQAAVSTSVACPHCGTGQAW